jgi:two-component system, cell cycle sensor histidine kinase PleC
VTTRHSLATERLRLLHRSSDGTIGVELVAVLVSALMLRGIDPLLLCGWVGAMVVWRCLRIFLWQRTRSALDDDCRVDHWMPWTIVGLFGSGLLWGIFGLAAMMPDLEGLRWLVVLVLGIVVTGGGVSYAAVPWAQLAFIAPAVLPLAAALLLDGPLMRLGGAAVLGYAELMVLMACAADRRATFLFGLQLEHEAHAARLGAAQRQAEEESQAKSRVLADMSHELRTPLNAIIGFADIIKSELFGPLGSARYADYAADIQACGLHLMGVASDVLELTKAEAGAQVIDIAEVDLKAVFRQVDTILRPSATKAQTTLSVQSEDLPVIRTDETKLRQILLNLVSNAIKFTPARGTITVRARVRGDRIEIAVADTGIGIAAADIPKALMPYGQVDVSAGRRNQGTGLGLPLASRFAVLLGGSLAIDSAVGEGTTVTVTLPLASG